MRDRVLASANDERASRDRVRALIDGSLSDGSSDALDRAHLAAPFARRKSLFHALRPDQLLLSLLVASATSAPLQEALRRVVDGDAAAVASLDKAMSDLDTAALLARDWIAPLVVRPFVKDVGKGLALQLLERAAEAWASGDGDAAKGRWTRGEALHLHCVPRSECARSLQIRRLCGGGGDMQLI
jgi:hypothetical protein